MIPQNIQSQITSIWDKYIADNKKVVDTKGKDLEDIDSKRLEVIETLKIIVQAHSHRASINRANSIGQIYYLTNTDNVCLI